MIGAGVNLIIGVTIDGFFQADVAAECGLTMLAASKRSQRDLARARNALPEAI